MNRLEELLLFEVHELSESSRPGCDTTRLPSEEADLSEDLLYAKVCNIGVRSLVEQNDVTLNNEVDALTARLLLYWSKLAGERVCGLLLVFNDGWLEAVLFITLFEYVIVHKEHLLLQHKDDLRLKSLIEHLNEKSLVA